MAVISPEGVGGITQMFLEEKCFQRRTGTSDYNFVTCNMMTYKITSFDVYVPTTKKVWITPRVLDADAYLFAYDSRVPQSLERLWNLMSEFIKEKGHSRFPGLVCEMYDSKKHRILPPLSGKHLSQDFGFNFYSVDQSSRKVRHVFEDLVNVHRMISDIETRLRRRRKEERAKKRRRDTGGGEDVLVLAFSIVLLVVLLGVGLYTLVYFRDASYSTRKIRRIRRKG